MMVATLFLEEKLTYDGTQLSSLWAFRHWGLQGDSIVAFRGPCDVKREALVDLADYREGSFIYSPEMLHFLVEHFENDLEKGILRQRLLVALTAEILQDKLRVCLRRRGDDLFFEEKKLSVSIATITPVSVMIHFGINLRSRGAPVAALGLCELGLTEEAIRPLAEEILKAYATEMEGVRLARCKVRSVP